MENEEIFVVCVDKSSHHIEASILTKCCKCACEIWCSITNAHRKTICMKCAMKIDDIEIGVTKETMEEVHRELKKRRNDDSNL